MKVVNIETHRKGDWIFGERWVDGEFICIWMKLIPEFYTRFDRDAQ
jgi:hypothetical protein